MIAHPQHQSSLFQILSQRAQQIYKTFVSSAYFLVVQNIDRLQPPNTLDPRVYPSRLHHRSIHQNQSTHFNRNKPTTTKMPDPHGILKRIPPMEYVQAMGWFEPGMPFHMSDSWGFGATWVDDGRGGYRPIGRGGQGQSGGHGRHGGRSAGHGGRGEPSSGHGGGGRSGGRRGHESQGDEHGYGGEEGGYGDPYGYPDGGRRDHGGPGGAGGHRRGGYDHPSHEDAYDDYNGGGEGFGGGSGGPPPPRRVLRRVYVVRR